MALNFPSNPSENDIYQFGLLTYIFKNGKWVSQSRGASQLPWYSNMEQARAFWKRLAAEAGLNLVDGSFEEGAEITSSSDVVWWQAGSAIYGWSGTFIKVVPTGSTPTPLGSGGWIDRSDVTLRGELASSAGSSLVGLTTGNDNTSVGANALSLNTTGVQNTALGSGALKLAQDGTDQTAFSNTSGVGFNAAVSGSNQVQLGNPATTTYVYGTVQNRSDERDKADVRDTELGIEFIMGLRPVDGRWDMREDYTEEYQVQVGVDENEGPVFETCVRKLPKDGSKKRERFHHWFIAQEVKALCDSLGVEFGGYQDHSVNGGCDVLSLGYDEFIPPVVKAIQQCWRRLDEVELRLDKLDPPAVSS